MADLIAAYPPEKGPDGRLPRYVYMETPNGDYYVGYDMKVCLHPQTLLVTEMSGSPAHAVSWRPAAAARTHQVRLQADQAYRPHRLYRPAA